MAGFPEASVPGATGAARRPRVHRRDAICLLLSGGLDSAVVLERCLAARQQVLPVYLRCGLQWEPAELSWLRRFLRAMRSPRLSALSVIDLALHSLYEGHWSLGGAGAPSARSPDRAVYLPGRNLLLVSCAAIFCAQRHVSTIALGVLHGNPFPDATPRFFSRLSVCLAAALRWPIQVVTPLRRCPKAQVIRAASAACLRLTFSCLNPQGDRHCGRCNKCAERRRGFHLAGVADPTGYAG